MPFTVLDPLTKLYRRIDDLSELATATHSPYSPQQLIDLGLTVIKNTNDYVRGLSDWYNLPPNQTWLTFKQHFQQTKLNLRKVCGARMRDTSYHGANQLSEDLQGVKEKMENIEEV